MIQRYLCLGVLTAGLFGAAHALAHGPEGAYHGAAAASPEAEAPSSVIPANLLAAVCGMPGHHHDTSFQRRVEVARVLLARAGPTATAIEAPLFDDLGGHTYRVSTASPQAQRYFDQGLRLTYGFNHPEALRAFRAAQRIDPGCALCYWGEAYALGPNINAPMDAEAIAPAITAIDKAGAPGGNNRAGAGADRRARPPLLRRCGCGPGGAEPAVRQRHGRGRNAISG